MNKSTLLPLFATCLLTLSTASYAKGLQVSPTTITMSGNQPSSTLLVSNTGDSPIFVQVRAYKWGQTGNDEFDLTPSKNIDVSPPLLTIAPKQSQEVRVIQSSPQNLTSEAYYRIIVDELPTPSTKPKKGVALFLRHNIPLFINPGQEDDVSFICDSKKETGNLISISCLNNGPVHGKVSKVWVEQDGREVAVLGEGLIGYALPGYSLKRSYQAPSSITNGNADIVVMVNGKTIRSNLSRQK